MSTAAAALAIIASQSPPYMLCVFLFRVFYNFPRREEAKSLLFVLHAVYVLVRVFYNFPWREEAKSLLFVLHAVCVLVRVFYNFRWERSGTIDLSRRPKIFVKAAI